jgi:hypothetical protein
MKYEKLGVTLFSSFILYPVLATNSPQNASKTLVDIEAFLCI